MNSKYRLAHVKKFADNHPAALAVALFFVALIPRIICLWQMQHSILAHVISLDPMEYDLWGQDIAKGNWLGKEVFYAAPLYPYFLGAIYSLFGHKLFVVRLIQTLIGALNCVLIFQLSKKIAKDTYIPIVSFLAAVCFGLPIFYELLLLPATLTTLFLLLLTKEMLHIRRQPTVSHFAFLGLILALATLMRPNFLVLAPIIILWIFANITIISKGKKALYAAAFTLTTILCIVPITLRNYAIGKDFVPLAANGGIHFYVSNGPYADGRYGHVPFLVADRNMIKQSVRIASAAVNRPLKPSEASRYWTAKTLKYIQKHPKKYCSLLTTKIKLFVSGFEMPDIFSHRFSYRFIPMLRYLFINQLLLIPLGLAGLLVMKSDNKSFVTFVTVFMGYALSMLLSNVNERYKLPLYPFFIICASVGVACLLKPNVSLRRKIIAVLFFVLLLSINLDRKFVKKYGVNHSASYGMLGYASLKRGEFDDAVRYFQEAVSLSPDNASAHAALGTGYVHIGRTDDAKKEFTESLALNPNHFIAHFHLWKIYDWEGNKEAGYFHRKQYEALAPR